MDKNKTLEMRLEDEPFLNSKPNFGQNLIGLHNRGIYTLNDFITMDLKSIPDMSRRNKFFRMIDILKCKYLGEDLVCDVLLQKIYPATYEEYLKLKEKYHYPDIMEEWLMRDIFQILKRDCSELGIPFIERKYRRLFLPSAKQTTLSMKDYLESEDIRDSHAKYLVDFYLEYLKIKNDKKDDAITSSELETLKKQLSSLTSQIDDLDKRIEDIKVQIQLISEGKNNARK